MLKVKDLIDIGSILPHLYSNSSNLLLNCFLCDISKQKQLSEIVDVILGFILVVLEHIILWVA